MAGFDLRSLSTMTPSPPLSSLLLVPSPTTLPPPPSPGRTPPPSARAWGEGQYVHPEAVAVETRRGRSTPSPPPPCRQLLPHLSPPLDAWTTSSVDDARATPASSSRSARGSATARPRSAAAWRYVFRQRPHAGAQRPAGEDHGCRPAGRASQWRGMPHVTVPMGQVDLQRVRRAQRAETVGPLHHNHAVPGVVPAEFATARRAVQPPQVEVVNGADRGSRTPGRGYRLGLGTSSPGSRGRARIRARARADLAGAERPWSRTASPARSWAANRWASDLVAARSWRWRASRTMPEWPEQTGRLRAPWPWRAGAAPCDPLAAANCAGAPHPPPPRCIAG